ncbi:hypothetical protein Cgig2_011994 [Carnegiea gigantea]|uniref:Uncharacterized protein n=1 Tax=Carnegiea gigantea TaxID=171969 RepID=A0A9Q1KQK8_9CARY|nr:hypothetical protein Cgig2_011994 [Carnegiea gigantea]
MKRARNFIDFLTDEDGARGTFLQESRVLTCNAQYVGIPKKWTCMLSLSPLAEGIWEGSEFSPGLWSSKFRTPADCFGASKMWLTNDEMREFALVLWEIWNTQNPFIFKTPDRNLNVLSKRAISFVRSYRESLEHEVGVTKPLPSLWTPPIAGSFKLNFDGGCVEERGWG